MLYLKIINIETDEFRKTLLSPESTPQSECLIGRNPNCDLILNSPDVSRYHAKISAQNGSYLFSDLNSTDGSRLNNEEIALNQEYVLSEEDTLRVGSFILFVEKLEAPGGNTTASNGGAAVSKPVSVLHCVRIVNEAIDTKTFSFALKPAVFFPYKPGQLLPLHVETGTRSISCLCPISSSPTRPLIQLTFKQIANAQTQVNLMADWFFNHINIGSELQVFSHPSGNFTCFPTPPYKLLFLSAGIGIVSIMSMLRWIYDTAANCDVTLLHSTRTAQHIPFRQELELMTMHLPNFRLVVTTTHPQGKASWLGLTGRISSELLSTVVPDLGERAVYAAGSTAFMQTLKNILSELSFPLQNYHAETFDAQSLIKQLHSDRELTERHRPL